MKKKFRKIKIYPKRKMKIPLHLFPKQQNHQSKFYPKIKS